MSSVIGEEKVITIDIRRCRLSLYQNGKVMKTFPVAVGAAKTPSPVGSFTIIHKAHWGGVFGTRWMGLDVPWGTYGIHGTKNPNSIGSPVSHGCIRMLNSHAEELYEHVSLGTPVRIDGPILYQTLAKGSTGNLVQMVQTKLAEAEYYAEECHGIFDTETEEAILQFQNEHDLVVTGVIHYDDLLALGISVERR